FLIRRGEGGRTSWIWSADVHAGFRYNIQALQAFELTVDVFNVTNNQGATQVDDRYTVDFVDPIVNGRRSDLRHLRTIDGVPARVNPNYRQPTQYQAPLSAQLGLRYTF
ncbi:MAG: TonB-dependent receptor, partial [Myxococcota bacterium]